jgi:hypothetical protein
MNKDLSDVLISGESEDYTIDDVITIGGINTQKSNQTPITKTTENTVPVKTDSVPVSSGIKSDKIVSPIIHQEKIPVISKNDFDNIEETMKEMIEKLSSKVSPNINKFLSMTKCENNLKDLYLNLENISKNRGSAKEIIEIGSKIQNFEDEKNKQFISDSDVDSTIENIKNTISLLGKFKNMLEVSRNLKS